MGSEKKSKTKLLKNVCQLIRGFSFDNDKYRSSGNAILKVLNVQEGKIDTNDLVYFYDEDYKKDLSKYILRPGDVVITISGASSGKIAINNTNQNFYISSTVCKFEVDKDVLDSRYLYYYLTTVSHKIKGLVRGGAVKGINLKTIGRLPIKVPSLERQMTISGILDKFLKLRECLEDELNKRQQQSEYYKELLLSLGGG